MLHSSQYSSDLTFPYISIQSSRKLGWLCHVSVDVTEFRFVLHNEIQCQQERPGQEIEQDVLHSGP